jgi:succinoglycan biosynthesis protein ExoL
VSLFNDMTDEKYRELTAAVGAVDRSQWVTSPADCRALVARLASLDRNSSSPAGMAAVSTLQS